MPIIPLFHQLRTNNERLLIVVWRNVMEDLKKITYIKRNAVKYFGNQLITSTVSVRISVYFLNCVTGIIRDIASSCQYLLYRSTSDRAVLNSAFLDSGRQRWQMGKHLLILAFQLNRKIYTILEIYWFNILVSKKPWN